MRGFLLERSRLAQTAVVSLLTLAAVALLGLVLAYWSWIWFAPPTEPRAESVAAAGGSIASAGSLFGNMQRQQTPAAPTGLAIRLLGVVAPAAGGRGYAVVQLETNKLLAVLAGEEIAPGVQLAEVHPDHVVLERGGVRETVAWPQQRATAPPVAKRAKK